MKTLYFDRRSLMTDYAQASKLEMIRCKLKCEHGVLSPAILLIDTNQIVQYRLIRCKPCKTERS